MLVLGWYHLQLGDHLQNWTPQKFPTVHVRYCQCNGTMYQHIYTAPCRVNSANSLRNTFRVFRMRVPIVSNIDMRNERSVGRKNDIRGISDGTIAILWISLPTVYYAYVCGEKLIIRINVLIHYCIYLHGTLTEISSKVQSGCMSLSSMTLIWQMTVTLPGSVNWTHSRSEMRFNCHQMCFL